MAEQTTGWRIERRADASRAETLLAPGVAIVLALCAGGIILALAGRNPLEVYGAMLGGALGDRNGVAETLVKMTPLLLAGLGVSVAFRMQLWNIGGEGQIYLGAIFATWIALFGLPGAPGWLLVPVMVLAGLLGGAAWGFIPGVLRACLGANETIVTLMLNYVAILIGDWLVYGPWKDPQAFGFPGTLTFPDAAWLPNWDTTRVHLGLLFGLIAAILLWVLLRRTRWGYEITVAGASSRAARYAGLPTTRTIVLVMMLSGALCGLAGMSEVAGIGHQLQRGLSPGYGYTAIIVAWVGRLHPAGIVLISFLLAVLLTGGDQIQMSMGLPSAIAPMLQGIILFFLLAGEVVGRYRLARDSRPVAASEPTSPAEA